MRKTVLIAALTIGLLMIPFLVYAEIYKWVDEKGTIHFTDDHSTIPEKHREQAERSSLKEGTQKEKEYGKPEEEKKTESKGPSASETQELPRIFSGVIQNVDHGARTIVVMDGEMSMVFLISENTSIKTDNGQKTSLSELKNGRSVTIEYIKEGGDNHARSIKVSILLAGTPNVVEENKDDKENQNGVGKMQNPGEAQKRVWERQKAHKKPKKSSK